MVSNEHGDFTIKNGEFTINNGDLSNKNGDLTRQTLALEGFDRQKWVLQVLNHQKCGFNTI
jgi:hypothetical protein